ncbi:MAG: hypothetical protein ACOX41_03455 [Anaerovoracaceae bacterium]|jgi:hypothetical protein
MKEKKMVLRIVAAAAIAALCSIAATGMYFNVKMNKMEAALRLHSGTYQLGTAVSEKTRYLALLPLSAEEEGTAVKEYEITDAYGKVVDRGSCRIVRKSFAVLKKNGRQVGLLLAADGACYYSDSSGWQRAKKIEDQEDD